MKLSKLREIIEGSFSHNELYTLCFDLGIPYENLRNDTKEIFVRELIEYCQRRKLLPRLVTLLARERPNIHWKNHLQTPKRSLRQSSLELDDEIDTESTTRRSKMSMASASIVVALIGLVGTIITVFSGQILPPQQDEPQSFAPAGVVESTPVTSEAVASTILPAATESPTPTNKSVIQPTDVPPSPTSQVRPAIYDIHFCDRPCGDSGAIRLTSIPEKATKIYAAWSYQGMTPGLTYSRIWTMNGDDWVRYDCDWQGDESGYFTVTLIELGGLYSGSWTVMFLLEDGQVFQESIQVNGNYNYWAPAGHLTCPDF